MHFTGLGVDLKILSGRFFLRYFLDRASHTLSIFTVRFETQRERLECSEQDETFFDSGLQNRPRTERDCGGDVEDEKRN